MGQQLVTSACPCLEPSASLPGPGLIPFIERPAHYDDDSVPSLSPTTIAGETVDATVIPIEKDETGIFQTFPAEATLREFDRSLPIFKIKAIKQKFHGKSTYDKRYAWIKLESRTICLSEFSSSQRKHKEARIAEITGVFAGPPEKIKLPSSEAANIMDTESWDRYLSVKFDRGGGIDLLLDTKAERDMWFQTLLSLLSQQETATALEENKV